jgi:hypothetical protein
MLDERAADLDESEPEIDDNVYKLTKRNFDKFIDKNEMTVGRSRHH